MRSIILNGPTYLGANFPLTLNLWVPLIGETLRYTKSPISNKRSLLLLSQPSNFRKPFELVSLHPSILLVQRLGILRFDSRIMGFCTTVHIELHTEPSRCYPDSYCCTRILRMAGSCPNFFHTLAHRPSTYLLRFD
jgi:hypothetical protein